MNIDILKEMNPHISIYGVDSENFRKYGRLMPELDFKEMFDYMDYNTSVPSEGNIYAASVAQMESMAITEKIEKIAYGEMPIQIGYCNGVNSKLNGLEYHKGSELDAAVTDLVLLLGKVQDIFNNTYLSTRLEAFYLEKGTIVELYGTTLHFAPCRVQPSGFKCIVALPRGTNTPLENSIDSKSVGEGRLLTAKNKWLLCHPERKVLVDKGIFPGIIGENIEIKI